jgi:hypothetical protein
MTFSRLKMFLCDSCDSCSFFRFVLASCHGRSLYMVYSLFPSVAPSPDSLLSSVRSFCSISSFSLLVLSIPSSSLNRSVFSMDTSVAALTCSVRFRGAIFSLELVQLIPLVAPSSIVPPICPAFPYSSFLLYSSCLYVSSFSLSPHLTPNLHFLPLVNPFPPSHISPYHRFSFIIASGLIPFSHVFILHPAD